MEVFDAVLVTALCGLRCFWFYHLLLLEQRSSQRSSVSAQILKHSRTTLSFSCSKDEIISFCRIFTDSDDWWHCGTRHGFLLSCFRKKINWFFVQFILHIKTTHLRVDVEPDRIINKGATYRFFKQIYSIHGEPGGRTNSPRQQHVQSAHGWFRLNDSQLEIFNAWNWDCVWV